MTYKYFSHNGKTLPSDQAVVSLSSIEYGYGYGVYETIRVRKGVAYFLDEHIERLLNSALVIELNHLFTVDQVKESSLELLKANQVETCNIKLLLIGGRNPEDASLEILCLNPLFPDRKHYSEGVKAITYNYERPFPQAKTLNMLSSYLAFRQAREAGAYDALLINHLGCITEGTRTNFFGIVNREIISPQVEQILPGITRAKVIEVARKQGFKIKEQNIKLNELSMFDNLFLTSTSSNILPLQMVDKFRTGQISSPLKELIKAFNGFLNDYSSRFNVLAKDEAKLLE